MTRWPDGPCRHQNDYRPEAGYSLRRFEDRVLSRHERPLEVPDSHPPAGYVLSVCKNPNWCKGPVALYTLTHPFDSPHNPEQTYGRHPSFEVR